MQSENVGSLSKNDWVIKEGNNRAWIQVWGSSKHGTYATARPKAFEGSPGWGQAFKSMEVKEQHIALYADIQ